MHGGKRRDEVEREMVYVERNGCERLDRRDAYNMKFHFRRDDDMVE